MEKIGDWKTYSASVIVPKDSVIYKIVEQKVKEAKECIIHELNTQIFLGPIKR